MDQPAREIWDITNLVLRHRPEVIRLACQQRAKFEGWLKFELAVVLQKSDPVFQHVTLEDAYAEGRRSDISFLHGATKWHVELKTANTNWRAAGLENRVRPVTDNMLGIAGDILALRKNRDLGVGLSVFCIFPVPVRVWKITGDQLSRQLRHIEAAANLARDLLVRSIEYIESTPEYGVCTSVVLVQ